MSESKKYCWSEGDFFPKEQFLTLQHKDNQLDVHRLTVSSVGSDGQPFDTVEMHLASNGERVVEDDEGLQIVESGGLLKPLMVDPDWTG